MATAERPQTVTAEAVARARIAIADVAKRTPVLPSRTLSERTGAAVALKAENLQRTGSFKVRGALNKLAALGDGLRPRRDRGERRQPRPGARRTPRACAACRARSSCPTARRSRRSTAARPSARRCATRATSVEECRRRRARARRRGRDGLRPPLRRPGRRRRPGHARARAARGRARPRDGRRPGRRRRPGLRHRDRRQVGAARRRGRRRPGRDGRAPTRRRCGAASRWTSPAA